MPVPYTEAELLAMGPLGLEAMHVWNSADGHSVTLNGTATSSKFKVRTMPGFGSGAEINDQRDPKSGRIGETPRSISPIGKTYTISGEIQAADLQAMRLAIQQFKTAFGDRDKEGLMWHLIMASAGDQTHWWQSAARVMQYDLDDDPAAGYKRNLPLPIRLPFLVGLRMSDPRFEWTNQFTVNDGGTGAVDITPAGSAPPDPSIEILVGGGTNVVTNDALGRKITLLHQTAGEHVWINFAERTMWSVENPTRDYTQDMDDDNTDWWDPDVQGGLVAGVVNHIHVTGATGLTVVYNPRSW